MKSFLKILSVFALTALVFTGCREDEFYLQDLPELSVSTHAVTVVSTGGVATIDVYNTRRWFVTPVSDADGWFTITPVWDESGDGRIVWGGEGNGQITVTVTSENEWIARHLTLNIETAGNLFEQVVISQDGAPYTEILLHETFGPGGAGNIPVGTYTGFLRYGSGANDVTFSQGGTGLVDVRTSAASPAPFSGQGNVMFSAANGGVLLIENIELLGTNRAQISFVTNQTNDVVSLEYSTDNGGTWRTLGFEKTTTTWERVTVEIPSIDPNAGTMSLRFTATPVSFGARIDDIRVIGGGVTPGSRLAIHPRVLTVGGESATHRIAVASNTDWIATSTYDWLTFAESSGTGDQSLNINVAENPTFARRAGTVTVSTTDGALMRTLTVAQARRTDGTTLIFAENFGLVNTASPWPTIANFAGWNTIGSSAGTIEYSSSGGTVDVRSNSVSGGFPGASAGNNVMFSAGSGGVFYIDGIDPNGYTDFVFSFGTNQTSDIMSAYFCIDDGNDWTAIDVVKTQSGWELVETGFQIPSGISSLKIRIVAQPVGFGARIDDIMLEGIQNP